MIIYIIEADCVLFEVRNEVEEEVLGLNSNVALPSVSLAACELNTSYIGGYEIWVIINCKCVSKTSWKRFVGCVICGIAHFKISHLLYIS